MNAAALERGLARADESRRRSIVELEARLAMLEQSDDWRDRTVDAAFTRAQLERYRKAGGGA